jgi:hypothetical protein
VHLLVVVHHTRRGISIDREHMRILT